MNLSDSIAAWAAQTPHKTALRFAGVEASYAALAQTITARAEQLCALGVQRGDRVAVLGYNHPELIHLLFACARVGAILVPLNWRLTAAEHGLVLNDCRPGVVIVDDELHAQADALKAHYAGKNWAAWGAGMPGWASLNGLPRDSLDDKPLHAGYDDPVLLVYTSGTTGKPKGALLTQTALVWNAINSQHAHQLGTDDHVLTDLPLFHVGGLNIQTFPALHCGATVTLHRRFDAQAALETIDADRPSLYLMVPATMQALISHPLWPEADLSGLRLAMAGSATIPVPLLRAFMARGVPVGQIYGATETAPIATVLRGADAQRKIGSCGKPATHCEVRLVTAGGETAIPDERGEIRVRGPNLMREYWGDPEQTARAFDDGWFCTGDIGHWDADGFLFIDDRKKDVIISGGENIYPAELENLLSESPMLRECAVVGCGDPRWGEVPVAVVVVKPGVAFSHADTLDLLQERLARFKLPKQTLVVDALPRNAMGKVLKHELRDYVAKELAR